MKNVLIIGCSANKLKGCHKAIDLYTGSMFQLLKSKLAKPTDTFEVLILSAKHGLVSANSVLRDYDEKMPSRKSKALVDSYCGKHKRKASMLLSGVASKEVTLSVVLSNDYLFAFDQMFSEKSLQSKFKACYISRKHKGIGELRGRLSRIIQLELSLPSEEPTFFRSGVANTSELGYVAAGCPVGGSLCHTNSSKMSHLLVELLRTTKHRPCFLDNGLITLLNQGRRINTDWVFDQYREINKSLTGAAAKNLYVVVPDDVSSNENAVAILKKHKQDILDLNKRVEVILPIHKSANIEQHALTMMEALGFPANLRLGIPCLKKKGLDLVLPLDDIERLLALKHPTRATPLFSKVHFFGMSEATSDGKLQPRLLLAKMYGLDGAAVSLDCCRTTALFGENRAGANLADDLAAAHLKKQVVNSALFDAHNYDFEHLSTGSGQPFFTQQFYDLINEAEIFDFLCLYNEIMADNHNYQLPEFEMGEETEAMEMAWQMIGMRPVDNYIFEKLKLMNWEKFVSEIEGLTELKGGELRFAALKRMFASNLRESGPIQLPLVL
ncbi:hypothetical protein BCT94_05770 [Vibrio breoganii]|uniref:DUF6884 domain-containing protein n=1 Tax=Vibrio breoganii TaxID=553239 RepID=UPI000C8404F8|nr:DUF6884 domain-containing protein [Vibrio breoganii]PMK78593.1 hypothetical protein BCT94_05770 [Vibrio breoganii]